MRVEHRPRSSGGDARRVATGTFVAALRRRLGTPRAAPPSGLAPRSRPASVHSVASALRQVRIEMEARVQVRLAGRTEAVRLADGLRSKREAEVSRSTREAPTAEQPAGPAPPCIQPPIPASAQARSLPPPASGGGLEAVLALVERVEHLLRSGRPVLAFTLAGRIQRVQLERVGPNEVGIRLHGARLGRAEAERLAAELGRRGLRLSRLEWSFCPWLP